MLCATLAASLLLATERPGATADQAESVAEDLRAAALRVTALLVDAETARTDTLRQLVNTWVDAEALSQRIYGSYLRKTLAEYDEQLTGEQMDSLVARHASRITAALSQRLLSDLQAALRQHSVRAVHVVGHSVRADQAEVDLLVLGPEMQMDVQAILSRSNDQWKLTELVLDGERVTRIYREEHRRIRERKYSPAVLEAALLRRPYVVLEDFSGTPTGGLPLDWGAWRPKDQNKPVLYRVEQSAGRPYLAASDSGYSVILGTLSHWNPRDYPIMTWCWRADVLPDGADETQNEINDSAAGVYVIFSQNWLGVPKQLKYVWSSTLPQGTIGRRNMLFRPWFFVLESGAENVGSWQFEQVDLAEHHRLKLDGKINNRTVGLAVLTDANSTASYAQAGYADLRVWTREALNTGSIHNYCECLEPPPLH
jgi:hypothetical protein